MKAVILDGYTTNPGDLSWDWLTKYVDEYEVCDFTRPEEVFERTAGCGVVLTNKTKLMRPDIDRFTNTGYIGLLSTGFDAVDAAYARTKNIPVTNIPAYSTYGVAQMTFSLLLEHTNRAALHNKAVKAGEWQKNGNFCFWVAPLKELYGKSFGIIGFGKIGRTVADIARAFGMNVLACTAHPEKYAGEPVEFLSLDELLAKSDVVSLHCPYSKETDRLVNDAFLRRMKPSAFLINTSRGAVVDEAALRSALDNGVIAGAGVDVLSTEPPKDDNPLLTCEKCVITPHIAWAAYETRARLMGICENNLKAFLAGKPINVVN
ncbi:MAG: D-2-hydroxyacid dehydrogenase [Oscillospiraceae bacterium]|nr:D-2-hydroxyacid dehydrogenase [Oscillospiraceae bacterium]